MENKLANRRNTLHRKLDRETTANLIVSASTFRYSIPATFGSTFEREPLERLNKGERLL